VGGEGHAVEGYAVEGYAYAFYDKNDK